MQIDMVNFTLVVTRLLFGIDFVTAVLLNIKSDGKHLSDFNSKTEASKTYTLTGSIFCYDYLENNHALAMFSIIETVAYSVCH